MSATPDSAKTTENGARAQPSLKEAARTMMETLHEVVHERALLFSLEAKRAGLALAQMVVMGVAAALLVITAWFGLVSAIVVGLVQLGMPWFLAILLGVAANGVGAWVLLKRARTLVSYLTFPSTLRHLHRGRANADAPLSDEGSR
ncbi:MULTISPECIES: phage holin family protein [Gulbenkiania]|nr:MULTISPECIES: phage holin family protein [Gulbenkiania]